MTSRRKTRRVSVGGVAVGGGAPVSVQSMTKTDTRNVDATVQQILRLADEGCEIVRVAVPDDEAAEALASIVRRSPIPVVADIHFDYRLALKALEAGVAKLRINPGNIGARERVEKVTKAAQERGVPIRIGVNAGSLERHLLDKYGAPTPEAMVESAAGHIAILESLGFYDILVSLKASDVMTTVEAYRLFASKFDYPLHVGVTEAGAGREGIVRSAMGIGILLSEGIGDTIRVSLTGDPAEEVQVGWEILGAAGLRFRGVRITSCPTCGRTGVDVEAVVREVKRRTRDIKAPIHIAVMGCAVNGPGEARAADVGIAAGRGSGLVFRKGEIVAKVPEDELVDALMAEVYALLGKGVTHDEND